MNRIFITMILLPAFFGQSEAQTRDTSAYAFTLQQAMSYAFTHQTAMLNGKLDEDAARYTVNEYRGIGLPQINGSVDFQDNIQLPTQFLPDFLSSSVYGILYNEGLVTTVPPGSDALVPITFGTRYNTTAGITASQLIFDGSYIVGLKAAKTYRELTVKNNTVTQADIADKVSKAYYSVLINNEVLNQINANVARLKKLSEDTRAMFENGFVEKIDASRVELSYNTAVTEKEKVERRIQLGYLLLKFQMGMDMAANLSITDKLEDVKLEEAVLTSENIDYTKRPEYDVLQTNQKLQQLLIRKNKSEYLPTLAAYGNISTSAPRNTFDFVNTSTPWFASGMVGAKLNVPIFQGTSRDARIKKSKVELAKINNSMTQLQLGISLEISTAKVTLQNAFASLQTQKRNMELADEISRVTKIKYEQGVGTNLEVVNAETDLKDAQVAYFTALYEAIISKVDLDKATGTLK
jgi:outer membrane protein